MPMLLARMNLNFKPANFLLRGKLHDSVRGEANLGGSACLKLEARAILQDISDS